MIGLFRRGRISEEDIDQQLDEIEVETQKIREHLAQLQEQCSLMQSHQLHERLEQPLSWEIKRREIEALVKQIHLETLVGDDGKKAVRVSVTCRFGESMALCKTYPSPKSLQEHQEGQEHIMLGTS